MKVLLTTAMVFGTVCALGATQPAEAAIAQPIASEANHAQVTPARWWGHRHWGGHPYWGHRWGWGWGHPHRYYYRW